MANPTAVFLSKSQSQQSVDRRLHGLTLYLARGTYFVVGLTILALSILGIPGYIADLVGQHSIARVTLSMMLTVGVIIVSLFIFLRRSDDWLVLLFALTIVSTGSWERTMDFGARSIGLWPLYRFFDGIGSILIIFLYFMFPNGVFVPAWTRKFSGFVVGWGILGFLLYLFPETMPWWPRNPDGFDLTSAGWLLLSGIGAYAQIYRFRYVSNPVERQQVKWIVLSIPFAVLSYILDLLFRSVHFGNLSPSDARVISDLLRVVSFLFTGLNLCFAMYRYKLWETDFYLSRALIYSTVATVLAGLWWLAAILVQLFLNNFIKQESSPMVVALLSGIPAAALFQPLRENSKKWVNNRMYKDQLDLVQAIVELQPENWQFVSLHDMAQAVMKNTARLLEIDKSAIYVFDNGTFRLMNSHGITSDQASQFNSMNVSELQKGKVIELGKENIFNTLVPLVVSRGRTNDLIGVLALGPRAQDRGYSRDHRNNLENLGKRAGMAIHFLQLHEKKIAS